MRLLQATYTQYSDINSLFPKKFILVESQPYGKDSDLVYHLAFNNEIGNKALSMTQVREIADTGRTIGFWQNLGGKGIFRPKAVSASFIIPQRIHSFIRTQPEAVLSFSGDTWQEIINKVKQVANFKLIAQNEL